MHTATKVINKRAHLALLRVFCLGNKVEIRLKVKDKTFKKNPVGDYSSVEMEIQQHTLACR